MTTTAQRQGAYVPLEERLADALANDCGTTLDEDDIGYVVAAVLPVILGPHQRVQWIDDDYGYRCPICSVFLCVPRRVPDPICPHCLKAAS